MNAVDVICVSYNHADYIEAALDGVRAQTLAPGKVILVDDASTDDTVRRARSMEIDNLEIVVNPHNRGIHGLAANLNDALVRTTAEFVAVLEGDDYWLPGKLAAQHALARARALDIVGTRGFLDHDGALAPIAYVGLERAIRRFNQGDPRALVFRYPFLPSTSLMYRVAMLRGLGGFAQPEGVPFIDVPTLGRCLGHGRMGWVSERLSVWRQHGTQTTQTRGAEMRAGHLRCAAEILEHADISEHERSRLNVSLQRYGAFLNDVSLRAFVNVLLDACIPFSTKVHAASRYLRSRKRTAHASS